MSAETTESLLISQNYSTLSLKTDSHVRTCSSESACKGHIVHAVYIDTVRSGHGTAHEPEIIGLIGLETLSKSELH